MARSPEPLASSRFAVEIDGIVLQAFSEITLPECPAVGTPLAPLVLRRCATGSRELYDWWDAARSSRDTKRNLVVMMLDGRGEPALRWLFIGAHPVAIHWSPLDANQSGVLIETLTLGFERMQLG